MNEFDCRRIVYSSSATVYGTPPIIPIPETTRLQADSPYGKTKVMVETIIEDLCHCERRFLALLPAPMICFCSWSEMAGDLLALFQVSLWFYPSTMYDFSQSCRCPSFRFNWWRPSRSTWESSPPPRTDGRRTRKGSYFESFWQWLSHAVNRSSLTCILGDYAHELEAMVPASATICMFLISHRATVWLWTP